MTLPPLKIGVLALQGGYSEHLHMLQRIQKIDCQDDRPFECFLVRQPSQLDPANLDALILPGGESTTMALIAQRNGCLDALRSFTHSRPCWGTCAGLILLSNGAHHTKQGGQELLGALDIVVDRNAFGAQTESFVTSLDLKDITDSTKPFPGVFIRAPVVDQIGEQVQVLGNVDGDHGLIHGSRIVAVSQHGRILGTAFHPELTQDPRVHQYFLKMVRSFYANNNSSGHSTPA